MTLLSSKLQSRLAKRAIEIREVEMEWSEFKVLAREASVEANSSSSIGVTIRAATLARSLYAEARAARVQANALSKDQKLDKQLLRLCYEVEPNWWSWKYD